MTAAPVRTVTQAAVADLAEVPATSRWVRSGGIRLHVLDYGGAGAPLVMIPGITSPAITMDFVARELTDIVHPFVVDVRGRGFSDSGPSYALGDYADDTVAVIEGLDLTRPVLLGHSMGARIAAVTAARGTPLRASVLVDPPLSGPQRGPYPTTVEAFLGQIAQAHRGTSADEVARSWPRWPRREQELRARWLGTCDVDAIVATHRGFETEDFFDTWPDVPAPTVLIHGADSPVVPADSIAELTRRNPRASLLAVPGAGHMVFWDEPGLARTALRQVLERLVGTDEL
ncbi:alpha/beta hydrolase [Pseudonocardia sulfidoxydans NBRC 16205]|uniref:Alpha/beta hydrolase n=1 Tax=Pseudonocardia sulfidoxydans NBRC 16205 TaxID=1223511 RepID=A0A511DJT8_9PSEU|nr:alpha/beta hydrolase [Pseudonocardia sulfidoxydans]GEL25076.1 alpha/beta hydrolase [Pseudonocardia sulfidoxydans NBRC 16205]